MINPASKRKIAKYLIPEYLTLQPDRVTILWMANICIYFYGCFLIRPSCNWKKFVFLGWIAENF